ncbi:unnamed protein product [Lepeophtheirus salmonis]|uniref:(salmon louse) hypothetical protein n=1 Tax=Lepeophtheirus salmonis TaxID=72036 RepID=A0A7R8HCY3_LEPSM|nr:unnamed protein product [Lepeophtheirus salmonis]CAF3019842.1 unnamed protein product [Lepeophtheirus salmonis]
MDDKSKDLENMNSDNGCVGSGRRILKVTQTKGLITSERGNARSSVVGKEAITATSESVHIPPQRLEDDEEYSTGFTEEISKKDFSNSENLEGEGTTQLNEFQSRLRLRMLEATGRAGVPNLHMLRFSELSVLFGV